jgi:hypothetical protein
MRNLLTGLVLVCLMLVGGIASAQCPGGNCSVARQFGPTQRNVVVQEFRQPYVFQGQYPTYNQYGRYQGPVFKANRPVVYGPKPARTTFFRIFGR